MTPWLASLQLNYQRHAQRTEARYMHTGPLRVLKSLYPEGDAVCHNVLVHPPSGLVGGDTLDIALHLGANTHALLTTPGATRFYRSDGAWAAQQVRATVEQGARLEWLPLETIAYNGCQARNQAVFSLAAGAEMMAWDIAALGLSQAQLPFVRGQLQQHLEVAGVWLERGWVDAQDTRWMDGPLGLAGRRCMGTLVFATGSAMHRERREQALAQAREAAAGVAQDVLFGVTSPHPKVVVVRTLSPLVEPTQNLLRAVWAAWREALWQMPTQAPRIWAL